MGVSAVPSPSSHREKPAAQKLRDRLHQVYESGRVMPVAFLHASHAAPLALIDCLPSKGQRGANIEGAAYRVRTFVCVACVSVCCYDLWRFASW